jgi:Bacterial extracellular solute-binding proteins, family 5 Middle/IstB-like ATP binding protein
VQEVFSGLYRLDNANRVVPDLATDTPELSPDSRTYTFHLRRTARFSNGDPVTSADVLYSWNRAAYLDDAYASIFEPFEGFDDTSRHRTTTMRGLAAPDDRLAIAKLTHPAGYLLSELALPVAGWIVDRRVRGVHRGRGAAASTGSDRHRRRAAPGGTAAAGAAAAAPPSWPAPGTRSRPPTIALWSASGGGGRPPLHAASWRSPGLRRLDPEVFNDDARLGAALFDRLNHRCHLLEFRGESYRFRQSLATRTRDGERPSNGHPKRSSGRSGA